MVSVIDRLKEGNKRFVTRINRPEEFTTPPVCVGSTPQEPIATILGCADSRVPVVTLFDQSVGDLFISRVVGNVAVDSVISTIEYGVDHLKTSVVVILGHTNCGAINGVVYNDSVPPYLEKTLSQIIDLKERILKEHPDFCQKELETILIEENINLSIKEILDRSSIVRHLVESGEVILTGAIYHVETGEVSWI